MPLTGQTIQGTPLDLQAGSPYIARYRSRDPDPGWCKVQSIDWYTKRICMSNGPHTYFPVFDQVEVFRIGQESDEQS